MSVNRSKANQPRFWGIWHQSGAVRLTGKEEVRYFHLGDVLSVIHNKCLSLTGLAGIRKILHFMSGYEVYSHQLGDRCTECGPYLSRQFPHLDTLEVTTAITEMVDVANGINSRKKKLKFGHAGLSIMANRYGEMFAVNRIPEGTLEEGDPIEDLANLMGGYDRIIVTSEEALG